MILMGSGSLVIRGTPTSKQRDWGSSMFLRLRISWTFGKIQSWYGGGTRAGVTAAGAAATAVSPGRAAFALADPTAKASPPAPPPCQIPDMSGLPSVVRGTGGLVGLAASCAAKCTTIASAARASKLRIASVYLVP